MNVMSLNSAFYFHIYISVLGGGSVFVHCNLTSSFAAVIIITATKGLHLTRNLNNLL